MLANGSTLSLGGTVLAGLMEIPEIGADAEKVDVTTLDDDYKQYENGISDLGELTFKFKYDNSSSTSVWRKLKTAEASTTASAFVLTLPDGTKFSFSAWVTAKLSGGGINSAMTCSANLTLSGTITITNPSS